MDQRESSRKLTNTALTRSGAQGDASPSAPCVGKKLRQETKSTANWKNFKTIEDWKKEFDSHPEWAGRSTLAMQKDTKSGASAFCQAFQKFCNAKSKGDNAAYQKLFESIFPKKQRDWAVFDTLEDWKKEFAKHPEWIGRTVQEMKEDSSS